ncbi:hypothetical protein [Bacillus atrophaeus]|uniref:hypothetical protein n=1 Tax=Bacillus atrophaeus TaxID=1452 RepID=UPI002E1BDD1B|nr:hypothetical protein [Bacillus atrophaeus]MED4858410.1 hypothetical protein [Bacillus atrophaeus]
MNHFHLKAIYIEGAPASRRLVQDEEPYLLSRKEDVEVHLDGEGKVIFLYETSDRMEQYKIQLSLSERKLSFHWFAWDGSSFVRMKAGNWLTSHLFSQFLKNTYFLKGKKQKMFFSAGKVKMRGKT